ncbi:MAG: hypothetical protein Q8R02_05630 [Hyphomonadaceae bacterium]|nr:hypothetical protein [Hyphomonadaceae bacterium]
MHWLSGIGLTLVLTGSAMAQAPTVWFGSGKISDETADGFLSHATSIITSAIDEKGRSLRPLTAEEAASPLLDRKLVKEIIDVGSASAFGAACGVDWENKNYLKLMGRERARGGRTTHQIAAISLVHGLTMSTFDPRMECRPTDKIKAETFYRRKWNGAG